MPTISRTGLKWRLHDNNNPPPRGTQDTCGCNGHTPCQSIVMIRFKSCPSLLLFPAVDIVVCRFKCSAIERRLYDNPSDQAIASTSLATAGCEGTHETFRLRHLAGTPPHSSVRGIEPVTSAEEATIDPSPISTPLRRV